MWRLSTSIPHLVNIKQDNCQDGCLVQPSLPHWSSWSFEVAEFQEIHGCCSNQTSDRQEEGKRLMKWFCNVQLASTHFQFKDWSCITFCEIFNSQSAVTFRYEAFPLQRNLLSFLPYFRIYFCVMSHSTQVILNFLDIAFLTNYAFQKMWNGVGKATKSIL